MSPPWSRPLEVGRLADSGADVDFAVSLAELPGLRSLQGGVSGSVSGRVHFTRERGVAVAELRLRGEAMLECQRCLRPLELPLDVSVRVALADTEAELERMPPDLEPMLAPGGRLSVGQLLTEELLLTLPIVPRHARGEACASKEAPPAQAGQAGDTQKPFAHLAELMKR